ncbi:MAG TPA: Flp pilus assembly protein CpaB, partial [Paraburkholderia sp.]|nr:Flp pilus assembly protein CpaB [Paraburkholderia sp.]
NTWLNYRADEQRRNLEAQQNATTPAFTIVVASRPMRFGDELSAMSLREIAWPQNAPPAGSFSKISELTSAKRIVLSPIDVNEPILAAKITGPGQRATLSAMLSEGKKAVTIRVDDVADVAGFVLPGDRVDIVLTRPRENKSPITDVVLENVRVLGVDQMADQRADKATVVKAVTLEVTEIAGQKLALASRVGSMSLLLRKAGDRHEGDGRELTSLDLTQYVTDEGFRFRTIIVTRPAAFATTRDEYSVPIEVSDSHAAAISEQQVMH